MQPVQKKIPNPQKKRLAAALVVLLGLVAIAAILIVNHSKQPALSPDHQADARYMMIDRPQDKPLRIEVTNSKGEQFALVLTDAGYQVAGQPDYPLNEVDIELMVKDLTILEATDLAGDAPKDEAVLQELGLGPDAPRVRASYQDGQSINLIFGADARTEVPSDFIMMAGDDKVYTISPETKQHFDRALNTLHPVPAINFSSSLVNRIRVEGEAGFVLEQQEGWWELKEPCLVAADSQAISRLLSSISNMRFALYQDEGNSGRLQDYGLATPRRRVVFELADSVITGYGQDDQVMERLQVPAQQIELFIGDDYENIGMYLLYNGKVYLGSHASMGFLARLSFESLRNRSPLSIPMNRLRSMQADEGGRQAAFSIGFTEAVLPNNELALDQDGNLLYLPLVTTGAEEIDSDLFVKEYLKLMNLAGQGALPDQFTADEEQLIKRYTFELLDGTRRELAFFPFDALHVAMRVNGAFLDYVSIKAMESLDFLSLMK